MKITGILGLLVLIGEIYVILMIGQSRVRTAEKVLWLLLVILLPLLGMIIWYFAGPGRKPF